MFFAVSLICFLSHNMQYGTLQIYTWNGRFSEGIH